MRRLLRVVGRGTLPPWTVLAGIVGVAVLLVVLLVVVVFVPQVAIDPRALTRDQWLTHVQDLRTSILQGMGGLAVLAGAVVAALNLRETSRQNRAVLELQRRGQTTERFTMAIEQLGQQGPEKLDVRIGAVYALEQIARDSVELHWPIMEVLTAYLREHASLPAGQPMPDDRPNRLPADHQAIATVIGRRRHQQDPEGEHLDLHETNLADVRWRNAHLEGAFLYEAHLERAFLREVHLERASLHHTRLDGASLLKARLEEANLVQAHLEGAFLEGAQLVGAWLNGTNLQRVQGLTPAQLRAASDPEQAHLSPEQAAWLGPAPAIVAPPAVASESAADDRGPSAAILE